MSISLPDNSPLTLLFVDAAQVVRREPRVDLRAGPAQPPLGAAPDGAGGRAGRHLDPLRPLLPLQRAALHPRLRQPARAHRHHGRVPLQPHQDIQVQYTMHLRDKSFEKHSVF